MFAEMLQQELCLDILFPTWKIMFYVNTSTSDEVRKPQNCERSSLNFVSNINPFLTKGFLVLSGGIKWEHWPEMG